MSEYDLSKPYIKYCEDVITGEILACEYVIKACKRFKSWFSLDDRYFDYDDVDRRIRLVRKLKHFKGKSAGEPFILLPWQQFLFAGIFGFKWVDTGYRVTKEVLLFCGRKNGKSSLAAAICIAQILIDNNQGQEIDFIATSSHQAKLGFEMTKNYCESIDPHKLIFSRYRDSIKMPSTKSEIDVRASDAMTLDGLNSSTFIADEAHAYKDEKLWHVLKSSQGFQTSPLAICITTAGYYLSGYFLYDWVKSVKSILDGTAKDDTEFALLYSLDEDDDWKDESLWIKANPSLGETTTYESLRDECTKAINQPSLEVGFRTKLLNQFVQSEEVWIPENYISKELRPIDLNDFVGEDAFCGVDLASVSDLTATTIMFPPNPYRKIYPDKFVFKSFEYIPSKAIESVNGSKYQQWNKVDPHRFRIISGNVCDYDEILKDQLTLASNHNIQSIAYDQWNSTQYTINAEREGLPMNPYSQALGNFNRSTKQLERLILSDKCIIDDDPCVKWCFNNVVLVRDHNDNCKPSKTTRENKIDPIISMCTALGVYLDDRGMDIEIV